MFLELACFRKSANRIYYSQYFKKAIWLYHWFTLENEFNGVLSREDFNRLLFNKTIKWRTYSWHLNEGCGILLKYYISKRLEVTNKNIEFSLQALSTHLMTSFLCLYCQLWTHVGQDSTHKLSDSNETFSSGF